mmetsp:Transcript_14777/g.24630  ORF Transcript_14777/g.24630 Transcript_14777/m.24630 type:complete len:215 (-) Transcript_14777:835-1479(-)
MCLRLSTSLSRSCRSLAEAPFASSSRFRNTANRSRPATVNLSASRAFARPCSSSRSSVAACCCFFSSVLRTVPASLRKCLSRSALELNWLTRVCFEYNCCNCASHFSCSLARRSDSAALALQSGVSFASSASTPFTCSSSCCSSRRSSASLLARLSRSADACCACISSLATSSRRSFCSSVRELHSPCTRVSSEPSAFIFFSASLTLALISSSR